MSVTNSMSVTISLSTARSAPQEVLGRRWRQQGAYGEVFLAPIAVRSPSAQSSQGCDFRLDSSKICHPITTRLADEFQSCYHITEMSNVNGIIRRTSTRWASRRTNPSVPQPICTMGRSVYEPLGRSTDSSWNSTHRHGIQCA